MQTDQLNLILEKHLKWWRNEEGGERADLRGADLQGVDLRGADLQGVDLRGAYLQEADLQGVDLRGAGLRGVDLWGAYLQEAYLQGADLRGADLRGADLQGADLRGADLRGADLQGADLQGVDLQGAKKLDITKYSPDLSILKCQPPDTKLTAYKFLNADLTSPYQYFQYEIGKTYVFDDANTDEFEECGAGGNLATLAWCLRNKSKEQIIGIFTFLAGDIAAIPFGTDGKFRVKKMKFEGLYEVKE